MKQNFTVRKGALDGVEAFLSVAQHRNFRRAAADLGVTPSAISQAIRALEARVGAALFIRTTRSVGLTEAGERFLSRAKPAFEELVAASEVARDLGQRPAGLLRLSVPRAVVPLLLEPLIASFCQAYPEIELEIAASGEMVDLAAGGFDAGIRLGQFIDPDMTAVRLTPPFPLVVVGSPDYLRGRKRPERIDDLRGHACLRMRRSNGSIAPWPFVDGNKTVEAHRLRAAHRARLPHTHRSGDPRRGTCTGARPAHHSADCRRSIAGATGALRRHGAGRFSVPPRQASGPAEAASLHRARQIPER
jgi:DNA-binding transcriptional LysR family regulator